MTSRVDHATAPAIAPPAVPMCSCEVTGRRVRFNVMGVVTVRLVPLPPFPSVASIRQGNACRPKAISFEVRLKMLRLLSAFVRPFRQQQQRPRHETRIERQASVPRLVDTQHLMHITAQPRADLCYGLVVFGLVHLLLLLVRI